MPEFADVRSVSVGDFKITYLNDGGGIIIPTAMYPASTAEGWQKYGRFLDEEGKIIVSIGGFLIETGAHKIVMDLGLGPMTVEFPGFGPFIGGKFMESFAQTGLAREDVTMVVYSHLHLDHCGWTTIEENGERVMTFPNARHVCTEVEWNFWLGDESGAGPNPNAVQKPLENKIEFISDGEEIAPGMTAILTPGHTPGHLSFKLDAGDKTVYLIVDLLHSEVQFYEPEWFVAFDVDPAAARASREGFYETLLQPNVLVADGHFADAVFGRLIKEDATYKWQPLE